MSLNYDLRDIDRFEKLNPGLTQCMCFACMFVGIGEITEENHERVAARIRDWQKLNYPMMNRAVTRPDGTTYGKSIPITIDQVKRYIGLKLNVGYMTPAAFGKQLIAHRKQEW